MIKQSSFGIRLALILFALGGLDSAFPQTPSSEPAKFDVREFVCPIGGERFTQDVGYGVSPMMRFVDGSWLGDINIDRQIPECPKNGLVLLPNYDDASKSDKISYLTYTTEQLSKLPGLLAGQKFRELKGKGRHERAHWLATQLGMPAKTRWELLIRSSWAAIAADERKRLVARLAEEGPALIDQFEASADEKLMARLFVINALRELGRFDRAQAQLKILSDSIPSELKANERTAQGIEGAISAMSNTIDARDDDRFPLGLSEDRWVSRVCYGAALPPPYGPITQNAKTFCDQLGSASDAEDKAAQEALKLSEDPERLAKLCAATPENDRVPGLKKACEDAKQERDSKAAEELVLHHASEVSAKCGASPRRGLDKPWFYACNTYQRYVEFELARLLETDDAAFKVICDARSLQQPDRASLAEQACFLASMKRSEVEKAKLLADPRALDTRCETTLERDRPYELSSACDQRRKDLERAEAQALADNPNAFAARCEQSEPPISVPGQRSDGTDGRCYQARRIREQAAASAQKAPSSAPMLKPEKYPDMKKVAGADAGQIVAEAKRTKTYPKRKPGDLY